MSSYKIFAFVGMPGAGKSVCVEHLSAKNWPSLYFGGITLDELQRRGLPVTPENEKMVREDIRNNEGMDAYAKRMLPKLDELIQAGHQHIIVDGLYSWAEYKILKEKYDDDLVVIAIAAPRAMRHKRLATRPERPLNSDEITRREYAEIENIEKGGPIANADYTILNDRDQTSLLSAVDTLVSSI